MGRPTLPEHLRTVLVNARLKPAVLNRLKIICFRRSILRGAPFSEGAFFTKAVMETPIPKPPTPEQVAAYIAANPKQEEHVLENLKLAEPISRKKE
jgi:hypothetical protein